ncbi:hypothetical protein M9434_002890 [Picochlorum sp. BPE23]|nr:hypothetical protein M9434_002890 [Picochlorum sp. BPE23]
MSYFSDEFQEGLRTKLHEIYYEHETNRTIEVRCGLHHTCNRFSLLEGGQLPFVHCEIIFPEEFSAESVYKQFKRIVKCLMGDANLIVYPEDSKGSSTSHRFFIVSTDDFKPSLEKSSSIDTEAKTELSMVFEASMQLNRFGDLTRTAAVCIRVLLCTYIRCNGSHSDLARNQNWKALLSSTNRSLSRKIKGEDAKQLRESQISLMNASILTSTSSERQERAINPREYPSPSNGNGKRQRSPDNDNAGRVAARAVQPRSGADGDTLAQGFNGSLPQSCEGDLLQGFNEPLPQSCEGDLLQGFNEPLPQSCEGDLLQGSPLKFDGLLDEILLQNVTSASDWFSNNEGDDLLMQTSDPFHGIDLSFLDNDANRSL